MTKKPEGKKKRRIRCLAVALAVLALPLLVAVLIRGWTYKTYTILTTKTQEDTLSFLYGRVGNYILKYGVDSATLMDRNGDPLWTVTYRMASPALDVQGNTLAIYDKNGTDICLCDERGQIGSLSADRPIRKARVCSQGYVAALMEEGDKTWIQYYDQTGSLIATLKATMDSLGYPLDLALSGDGLVMGVSYLYYEEGLPKDRIAFYHFGSAGKSQTDNLVSSYDYSNILIPQLTYLEDGCWAALREDGITFFQGSQIPEKTKEVTLEADIVSSFADSSHVGLAVEEDGEESSCLLLVYNKKGREILRKSTDFSYQSIEMEGSRILLHNRSSLCVYSLAGIEKYQGDLTSPISQLFLLGKNRYVLINEEGFHLMKLG